MQILTIQKRFEAFQCKCEPFKRDSKHSNANSNPCNEIREIRMQILIILKGFEAFECNFELLYRKGFEAVKSKFERFEKGFKVFECDF